MRLRDPALTLSGGHHTNLSTEAGGNMYIISNIYALIQRPR